MFSHEKVNFFLHAFHAGTSQKVAVGVYIGNLLIFVLMQHKQDRIIEDSDKSLK